ncbi:mitochondrial fission ELM1 family protein [Caldovatus aquaticus]|uniref:Mitochondrial fission ELM1 family protein n=1 Tax=Caldovatus aquaticus TaxID=2865671 RepID=A0ABS7F2L3_9PROT|nr:ELM1/GtrOC1 family putative glycosyltransferase [Caldovatus aquaticus]MBW8269061.1 mitochondrial fission ELM1 family protein [Caldovatus aquaticus]
MADGTEEAEGVLVLADPRAGTAAQALGIAERLGVPFRTVPLAWSPLAGLPLRWPTLAGLAAPVRQALRALPPGPRLVLSAGRRSAPVALWLRRHRGVRTVHCMRPGFGAARFDLLVLGRHDAPWAAPNLLPILGATHRVSAARLAAARAEWAGALAPLPRPRVALLLGGPARAVGLDPAPAAALGARVAGFAGAVLATTSRRTGRAATEALAAALAGVPHRLHRWGEAGPNPYLGFLAWADAVVVSGDSVSMISEALAGAAPVFIADLGASGVRQRRLHESLYAAGQARPVAAAPAPFARAPLDESGRVAAEIRARGLLVRAEG